MLADVLSLFAPIDWFLGAVASDPVSACLWSALWFLMGFGAGKTLTSGFLHRLAAFRRLSARERWCLGQVLSVEDRNMTFSTSSEGFVRPTFEALAQKGILMYTGSREIDGIPVSSYTIEHGWRAFLKRRRRRLEVSEEEAGLE